MLIAFMAAPALAGAAPNSPGSAATPAGGKAKAERELVEAEIAKTRHEAKKLEREESTFWRLLPSLAPLLTAIVAGAGLFISVRKAGNDRRDALDREAQDRQAESDKRLAAEQAGETTRFDERFAKAVEGLSSENPGEQGGAAVLVASMVREKRAALSDQALQLLLVSLQTAHDDACERLLRAALQRFAHAAPERLLVDGDGESVGGLAHIRTSYLKLPYLALPGLDLAFAVLRKAEFRGATLSRCQGYETKLEEADFRGADLSKAQWVKVDAPHARFQKAILTRARLHKADLSHANFYEADLSRANLRQALLPGVDFRRATLNRADFHGAQLDEKALRSILGSDDWRLASFDQPTEEALQALVEEP
jgi:uncharacterized protein YjbI with pentapeptide repeats